MLETILLVASVLGAAHTGATAYACTLKTDKPPIACLLPLADTTNARGDISTLRRQADALKTLAMVMEQRERNGRAAGLLLSLHEGSFAEDGTDIGKRVGTNREALQRTAKFGGPR